MEINRAQREAARHKKTEAVDSFVAHQKDEPVCLHQDGNKTLWRSGVVTRNDKNVGHEAMQRARELLNSVECPTFSRPNSSNGANDDWFKNNQQSVEQQIGERISVGDADYKRMYLGEFKPDPKIDSIVDFLRCATQKQVSEYKRERIISSAEYRQAKMILKQEQDRENPQVQREVSRRYEQKPAPLLPDDFYNYRPQVDDDAPDYIPKSER